MFANSDSTNPNFGKIVSELTEISELAISSIDSFIKGGGNQKASERSAVRDFCCEFTKDLEKIQKPFLEYYEPSWEILGKRIANRINEEKVRKMTEELEILKIFYRISFLRDYFFWCMTLYVDRLYGGNLSTLEFPEFHKVIDWYLKGKQIENGNDLMKKEGLSWDERKVIGQWFSEISKVNKDLFVFTTKDSRERDAKKLEFLTRKLIFQNLLIEVIFSFLEERKLFLVSSEITKKFFASYEKGEIRESEDNSHPIHEKVKLSNINWPQNFIDRFSDKQKILQMIAGISSEKVADFIKTHENIKEFTKLIFTENGVNFQTVINNLKCVYSPEDSLVMKRSKLRWMMEEGSDVSSLRSFEREIKSWIEFESAIQS